MGVLVRSIFLALLLVASFVVLSCSAKVETNKPIETPVAALPPPPAPAAAPSPAIPNLQNELLNDSNNTTAAPIGKFDFKNYTYELPRGWQNPDGTTEITLTNGKIAPIEGKVVKDDMSDEDKVVAKSERRIGMSYVATKYFDVTGDGEDEALVVLKIETAGSAIPQLVYVFTWKDGKPELIWPFRTGDRADGGLKSLRAENGMLRVELYGQDRFVLGQTETGKITDDVEQLCCPTYFTRSFYKWNGKNFLMQGKRLTFSITDQNAPPVQNMGEATEKKVVKK